MPNQYGQLAAGMPPPQGMPQGAQPPNPQMAQDTDSRGGDPAIASALQMLQQAGGSIGDHLDDPKMQPHLLAALQAVKQDPKAQQALAQIGVTSDKIQLFEAELSRRMAQPSNPPPMPSGSSAASGGASSWLNAR